MIPAAYFILISALICNVSLALLDKKASTKLDDSSQILRFSLMKTLLCAVLAMALLPFNNRNINETGILIAVLGGIFHAASVVLIMQCLKYNEAVNVNLFMSAGIILPSLLGWILWEDQATVLKICSMLLLIFSLKQVLNMRFTRNLTFKLLLSMFFCYGCLMVVQGMYPKYCAQGSKVVFSAIMYSVSAVILAIAEKRQPKAKQPFPKLLHILLPITAAVNLLINLLLTSVSGMLHAAIVFPVVHGIKLVALTLLSPFLWKERLSATQITFCFLAVICICVLSIT